MSVSSRTFVEDVVGRRIDPVDIEQVEIPKRPYLPFPAAVAGGVIDFSKVIVRRLKQQVGVSVANGRVPQQNDAGLIEADNGLIAVDHANIFASDNGKEVIISPSDKCAIDKCLGRILLPGVVTLSSDKGWVKIIATIEDAAQHPWSEFLDDAHKVGGLIVRQFGLDGPVVELNEVAESGLLIAKPNKKQY